MRAVVTGGCGFIGRSLVERLVKEGYKWVEVIDDLSNPNSYFPPHWNNLPVHLSIINAADDEAWDFGKADDVFHLACSQQLDSFDNVPASAISDVLAGVKALEYCKETGARLLYASSVSVESDTLFRSPYAMFKDTMEMVCEYYRVEKDVDVVIVRFSNVYGPGNANGAIGKFLRSEEIVLAGDGQLTRDFTFIDDAIEALIRLSKARPSYTVPICTGKETSILKMASLFNKPVRLRELHPRDFPIRRCGSTVALRNAIGSTGVPSTSIEDGIAETIKRWEAGER